MSLRSTGGTISVLAMLGLLLAGCAGEPIVPVEDRLSPDTVSAHVSYAFAQCSAQIPKADQSRIRSLLNRMPGGASNTIVVTVPRACSAQQDAARVRAISDLIGTGHGRVQISAPGEGDARGTRGIVRVIRVDAIALDGRDCYPSGGCAVAQNLAAQTAYPEELAFPSSTSRPRYHVLPTDNAATLDKSSDDNSSSGS